MRMREYFDSSSKSFDIFVLKHWYYKNITEMWF